MGEVMEKKKRQRLKKKKQREKKKGELKNKTRKETTYPRRPSENWIVKHRPRYWKGLKGQQEAVDQLKKSLETKKHLLVYGPPSSGKTSALHLLYPPSLPHHQQPQPQPQWLYATPDTTNFIESLQKILETVDPGSSSETVIIIGGVKNLFHWELNQIKEMVQSYSTTEGVKFIIESTTDFILWDIDPLSTNFTTIRFERLPQAIVRDRLQDISNKENLILDCEVISCIEKCADGFLSQAIKLLQDAARPYRSIVHLMDVVGAFMPIPPYVVKNFLDACRDYDTQTLIWFIDDLHSGGYQNTQFYSQLYDEVHNAETPDVQLNSICSILAIQDENFYHFTKGNCFYGVEGHSALKLLAGKLIEFFSNFEQDCHAFCKKYSNREAPIRPSEYLGLV